jgi:SAM-dependent methyltransferase
VADAPVERHNRAQRRYFEEREKRRMRPASTPYLRRHVDELVRFASLARGDRVLEVGCGMGRYTFLLADRGLHVEGLDLSPVLLERLRLFGGGRYEIPLYAADVADPPPGLEERFDAVVGLFALHHVHDLRRCFLAMARLVRSGGRIAFLEPNPLNPLYYVQMAITPGMTWAGDGGIVRMRPRIVLGAMAAGGLRPFPVDRFGFFPPFAANARGASRLEAAVERARVLRPFLPFQLFGAARP